jgi:hypothetical protein
MYIIYVFYIYIYVYMYENQRTQIAIPQNCPFIHSQDLLALLFCIGCSELVHFIQGSWPTLRWATRSPSWLHCPTQSVPKALHQGHSVPLFPQHWINVPWGREMQRTISVFICFLSTTNRSSNRFCQRAKLQTGSSPKHRRPIALHAQPECSGAPGKS